MRYVEKNDKTALGIGISLIITTVTIFTIAGFAIYKVISVLNKMSHALDLYIDEHDFYNFDDEDDYYKDDDGYINCECAGDDDADAE